MNFDAPEEPTHLKGSIAERATEAEFILTDELEWVVPIDEPAHGRVVLGTEIVSYLWCTWENELREVGFTYQEFAVATTYSASVISAWATDETTWKAVIADLTEQLNDLSPTLLTDLSPSSTHG